MVGFFSRFSVNRNIHQRTQSALLSIFLYPSFTPTLSRCFASAAHGIEVAVEFKPLEHPIEPLDNDRLRWDPPPT
ncbi:uncharacterized protein LOC114272934 [Camellia sinensis]|uniref:uncharacterized protein LOC114272934 n=1 Tax=Camellia sinensis TaxID=4442 RepID=UPI0010357244|nr:uncharacterized protein LOC114272934 [Camellia sinensis]